MCASDNCDHIKDIAVITAATNATRCFDIIDDRLTTMMYLMRSTNAMVLKAIFRTVAFF